MSNILIEIPVILCENIGCTNTLGYFDIKAKRRFCRNCRVLQQLEWKCRDCGERISNARCRETRKRCNRCQGLKEE